MKSSSAQLKSFDPDLNSAQNTYIEEKTIVFSVQKPCGKYWHVFFMLKLYYMLRRRLIQFNIMRELMRGFEREDINSWIWRQKTFALPPYYIRPFPLSLLYMNNNCNYLLTLLFTTPKKKQKQFRFCSLTWNKI